MDRYKKIERIGGGVHGYVYKAMKDNKIFAVKQMSIIEDGDIVDTTVIETSVLNSLNHNSIIKIEECVVMNNNVYMIMPYRGICLDKRVFNPSQARSMIYQLLSALKHMQDQHIIHRDIKPDNIVMDDNTPIIIDFGLASQNGVDTTNTNVVTILWRTPELFVGRERYDNRIDVWSLGVVMFNILTGRNLFRYNGDDTEYFYRVISSYNNREEWCKKYNIIESITCQSLDDLLSVVGDKEAAMIKYMIPLDYNDIPQPLDCLRHEYFDMPIPEIISLDLPYPYPFVSNMEKEDRRELMKWLLSLTRSRRLGRYTFVSTIILFDRYMKFLLPDRSLEPSKYQIVMTACFLLSSQITTIYIPSIESVHLKNMDELLFYIIDIYRSLGYQMQSRIPSCSKEYISSLVEGVL